jgi:regulator of protease activity HflC (stomatin/prohibitin superfamily)
MQAGDAEGETLLDQTNIPRSADRSDGQGATLGAPPQASLRLIGLASLVACAGFLIAAYYRATPSLARMAIDPIFARLIAASLAILAGAFLASELVLSARQGAPPAARRATAKDEAASGAAGRSRAAAPWRPVSDAIARIDVGRLMAGRLQAFVVLTGAGGAIGILTVAWPTAPEVRTAQSLLYVRGAFALGAAFPLLLAERACVGWITEGLPQATLLLRLLRLALFIFVIEGVLALLDGYGFSLASWAQPLPRVLLIAIAAELTLRALASFFLPSPAPGAARVMVASLLATPFTPRAMTRPFWRRSLQNQFGIDLSRSWALQFMRSALVPVTVGIAIVAWALTGITALGTDERGIYERFGRPVSVFKPGIHIGLPWPLGVVRRVDFGKVHALSLGGVGMLSESVPLALDAEDEAPESADRLWDANHPTERSYLIASETGGRTSFQIVDVDVQLIWRVGLSDSAALASAYQTEDPEAFLRAYAGRLLARYFSSRTLLRSLGERREGMAEDLKGALQLALDDSRTGIELVAVVVEAIHPPAKAADSYHEVQAAHIRSEAMIAEARRRAVETTGEARTTVLQRLAAAQAAAVERSRAARSDALRFATDEQAYINAGSPYLFERYLAALTRGLKDAPVTLLDHRIAGSGAETVIDLRNFRAGIAAPTQDDETGYKEPSK